MSVATETPLPMLPRPLSAPSSTASFPPALSSTRSVSSLRIVSLPGLMPGSDLGVLIAGYLDKRRDGAVRAGWARRWFVLSNKSLHYCRRVDDKDLFGRERGQIPLDEIGTAKMISPDDAPNGAVEPGMSVAFLAVTTTRRTRGLFLRADNRNIAQKWIKAINKAVQTAHTLSFAPRWPSRTIESFIQAAAVNFDETSQIVVEYPTKSESESDTTQEAEREREDISTPSLVAATVVSGVGSASRERLVGRNIEIGADIKLGEIGKKDFCMLVLSDGDEIRISRQMLGNESMTIPVEAKTVVLSTQPRAQSLHSNTVTFVKVHVTVSWSREQCLPVRPPSLSTPPPHIRPSVFAASFSGGLAGLFLLSLALAWWCGHQFASLMKLTIVVGVFSALSQLGQFVLWIMSQERTSAAVKSAPTPQPPRIETIVVASVRVDRIEAIEGEQSPDARSDQSTTDENATTGNTESDSTQDATTAALTAGPIFFSPRFIAAEKGDEVKGRERYENTLAWRKENGMDTILVEPQVHFDVIKQYYPQFFHGRSKDGWPVYYEQPGKIDLAACKRSGLTIDDLLRHYMYITEYMWRVIEPSDSGRSITVLDVTGIGMSDLGGEVQDFIKRASAFTGQHYPERSAHIFIINIPGWFSMIWRVIRPWIDPVTREKVHMLKGGAILRELQTLVDLDEIPSDFGGNSVPLGQSDEEKALFEHVHKYLEK